MSDIAAVLLIPADGDPHGLLKEGPCGAVPPMMGGFHWHRTGKTEWRPGRGLSAGCGEPDGRWMTALVLAWDGEPVVEGIDRARRAQCSLGFSDAIPWQYGMHHAMQLHTGLGTIILLDADGNEVTP